MNLLTQDAEVDLEVLTQQPTTCTANKGTSKRGSNYNHYEDIQLCDSWMNITNDPISPNEQPNTTYWSRIADNYNTNKKFAAGRTASSLEHRWGIIQKECLKFQGFYEEVERRHPSGIPDREHVS